MRTYKLNIRKLNKIIYFGDLMKLYDACGGERLKMNSDTLFKIREKLFSNIMKQHERGGVSEAEITRKLHTNYDYIKTFIVVDEKIPDGKIYVL